MEHSVSPSPSAGGQGGGRAGWRWQTLGKDQRMPAGPFRYEACPKHSEPCLPEPGNVGGPIGVAPVHRSAMPIVLDASPGSGAHGGEQETAGPEPAVDLLQDRQLLLHWHMDD